ncbi:phospholipase A1 PLIP2, chloroplastic-like [Nymphaea colorata]|nr:phospholipase A1 PLIP2, chloroplastic-like [Nymphaea colorata]
MDGLCLKSSLPSLPSSALDVRAQNISGAIQVCAKSRNTSSPLSTNAATVEKQQASPSSSFLSFPFRSFWSTARRPEGTPSLAKADIEEEIVPQLVDHTAEDEGEGNLEQLNGRGNGYRGKENWVLKILYVRSLWKNEEETQLGSMASEDEGEEGCDAELGCCCSSEDVDACSADGGVEASPDPNSFSRLLRRVSLSESKLYGRMSYLGNLAYDIPNIKTDHLLKHLGLRFITSSLEKKPISKPAEKEKSAVSSSDGTETNQSNEEVQTKKGISLAAAYQIAAAAAAAASYLHTRTRSVLPFTSSRPSGAGEVASQSEQGSPQGDKIKPSADASKEAEECMNAALDLARCSIGMDSCETELSSSDVASLVATTKSVTAVIAAKEEAKQAVAKDLNSAHSSPCEWFVCDDDKKGTRYFVIQGSESLASWQANLLFEPIKFEGLDVLVHRGIYEAAKGIYQQMLPEVQDHVKQRGDSATFRFTGHSLGGSLALLVNLMLLIRGEVPASSLLPVITFGAPCIMCGGDYLLRKLGLPRSHVQAITMHRDIVPRAFSCSYPGHVAELLKAINVNFRRHPCLKNQKLLYAPMGEMLILQPDEGISPHHHLLPSGSGLYVLDGRGGNSQPVTGAELRAAKFAFLNSPHPLETLSDPGAYGSEGAISRDHDAGSYVRSVHSVIRQELRRVRREKREERRKAWWPLVMTEGLLEGSSGAVSLQPKLRVQEHFGASMQMFGFLRIVIQGSRDSLMRFSRLIVSHRVHMLVILTLPVRLLVLGDMGLTI